jgi:hypothetical protein
MKNRRRSSMNILMKLLYILETPMNETYAVPNRKGDEELLPPKLKHLPRELKYKFIDDTNKCLVTISANLSEG